MRKFIVFLIALVTVILALAACENTPQSTPYRSPQEIEELRRQTVERECARYPERCQDWDEDFYDDSNEPRYGEVDASGCPNGCTTHKSGCDIKGNISYNTKEKIYHVPGQNFYNDTKISPEYGERWFCTEKEARDNGWRKAKN